jgi:hypothetical protein
MNRNSSSFSYKSIDINRYKIIGNNKYDCLGDAKWFPTSPPIVQPIITCVMPDLSINHSDYSIEVSKFDYLNETMVASIDTRLIYTCWDKSINKIDKHNQKNIDEHEFASGNLSSKVRKFSQYCDENGEWSGTFTECAEEKNKTISLHPISVKIEGNALIIPLISLITLFALTSIGLFIFGAYFICNKKKNEAEKMRKKMNESWNEDYYDVIETHTHDSISMENDIYMTNILIQGGNDYDELSISRSDDIMASECNNNNDKLSYEMMNETNCSVKNDDDEYVEKSLNENREQIV